MNTEIFQAEAANLSAQRAQSGITGKGRDLGGALRNLGDPGKALPAWPVDNRKDCGPVLVHLMTF